jgi:hypothetical protein
VRAEYSATIFLAGLGLGRHADRRAVIGRSLVWGGTDVRHGDGDGDVVSERDARLRDDL